MFDSRRIIGMAAGAALTIGLGGFALTQAEGNPGTDLGGSTVVIEDNGGAADRDLRSGAGDDRGNNGSAQQSAATSDGSPSATSGSAALTPTPGNSSQTADDNGGDRDRDDPHGRRRARWHGHPGRRA